jgi:hypothetical protein
MVNFPGRNGRRRRVLNDEVLAASGSRAAYRTVDADDDEYAAPRYSDAAGVEHHPQITDFVPRRYRTIAGLVVVGTASTLALAALHYASGQIAAAIGATDLAAANLGSHGSVAGWVSAVVLLLASALCFLIYSIRRHRIDDFRGRYRIWIAAAVACLILSANSVAGLHQLLSQALTHFSGWTALRNGSVWWVAICSLPVAWIVVRTLLDVFECRLAATLWVAAIGCYAGAMTTYLGGTASTEQHANAMVHASLTLVGHWLVLAAAVSYARYIVLDAQGLIPARSRRRTDAKAESQSSSAARSHSDSDARKPILKTVSAPAASSDWVDGRRPERELYDDSDEEMSDSTGKVSKSDRKKLRKLKTQSRAA